MPTTTNFGWTTPADTDLVKDGASAIRTLGNGIDTSLVDLKGGTTGQILSKASNTDMDFTWTNGGDITEVTAGVGISGGGTSGAVTITNSMATAIDAKGDLVAGTGADTFSRLAVGANDTVLTADSTTATGLKWATPSSAATLSQITSGTFSGSSLTFSGLTLDTYIFMSRSTTFDISAAANMLMKFNSIATGYRYSQNYTDGTNAEPNRLYASNEAAWQTVLAMNNGAGVGLFYFEIQNCKATGYTRYGWDLSYRRSGNTTRIRDWGWGVVESNAQITSITFELSTGTWSNGSYSLYGA
jgi:hypothetical protein